MLHKAIKPVAQLLEAFSVCHVEDKEGTYSGPVVTCCDRAIAFRPARVPNLCFHHYSTLQYYLLSEELNADGRGDASEDSFVVPMNGPR